MNSFTSKREQKRTQINRRKQAIRMLVKFDSDMRSLRSMKNKGWYKWLKTRRYILENHLQEIQDEIDRL